MKLNIIDFDKEFGDLPVVTSPQFLYRAKSFHKDGIFSEQIFGPVNDYKCQCGKLYGKQHEGEICPSCEVMVTSSDMRRNTFARIVIPENIVVVNPILIEMMDQLKAPIKPSKVINGKVYIKVVDNDVVSVEKTDDDTSTGPEAFKLIYYPYLVTHMTEFEEFDKEYGNLLYIHNLPVIPPDVRPIMQSLKDTKQYFSDEINEKYLNILREIADIKYAPFIFSNTHLTMQVKVNVLFKTLMSKFEKKSGFLRSHVLGKRIDYSGRAVITVDGINMPLGYCKVPLAIAMEIYKPQVIRPVSEKLKLSPLKVLKDYYKPYLKKPLLETLRSMFVGTYVLLNRQPTLHRPSIQSAKIFDIIEDDVITIHPLVTDSYNAD